MKKFFSFISLLIVLLWTVLLGLWNIGASGGYSFFTNVFDYITTRSAYLTFGVLNAATIGLWAFIWIILLIKLFKKSPVTNKGMKVFFSFVLILWLIVIVALNIDGSFPEKYSWLKWIAPLGAENTLLWINIITDGLLVFLGLINLLKILGSKGKSKVNNINQK